MFHGFANIYQVLDFVNNYSYFAVDTKSFNSPPISSNCSKVLASPVDCRPITTHWNKKKIHMSFNSSPSCSKVLGLQS